MAVMIVSASMPFSLASASIVCINGFCICLSEFNFQTPAGDQRQRQPMHPSPRSFEQDDVSYSGRALFHSAKPPLERLLVVDRLAHDDLREPAGEPPVVVGAAKRPIEPRRRNLEGVGGGQWILDVEDRAHLAVHL